MEQLKINKLSAPTWNWLKVNETQIAWEGETAPLKISVQEEITSGTAGTLQYMETGALQHIETGAGREADRIFFGENTAGCRIDADGGEQKTVRLRLDGKEQGKSAGVVEIYAGNQSNLTVIMDCRVKDSGDAFFAVRTLIQAEKGANVRLVQLLIPGSGTAFLNDIGGTCAEEAGVELIQLCLGKGDLYDGCRMNLCGRESRFSSEIGYLCQGSQKLDMNLEVNHLGEKTQSFIRAEGTLKERADKIFRGTIDFKRGSAGAEGQEEENVLLLGDDVRNRTVPLILCAEEDVKGNHGATIGEPDEEALFYFASRGIGKEMAEDIMTRAKLERLCSRVQDEETERIVKNAIDEVMQNG